MAQYELSDEQVASLKRAINHELNDNSYCMGQAGPSTKERLLAERKVLNGLYEMLSRRSIPSFNEVENDTVSEE